MDRLSRIQAFLRVAEEGSFSAAARSLRTTQPSVSKAIAELESALGTRLLHRTTRSLRLTEAGSAYYERTKPLLAQLDEAEKEASSGQDALRGRLRVNTSGLLAGKLVVPAVMAFRRKFPGVAVEITMEDRRIDLFEESADVVARIGALSDSTLRSRRAGEARIGVFASAAYLAEHDVPINRWDDLAAHDLIKFPNQKAAGFAHQATAVRRGVPLRVSNSLLAKAALLAGGGVAALPFFLVNEELAAGSLIQVLPGQPLPAMQVNLLHPFTQAAPRRVTSFIDFAIERWRNEGLLTP